MKRFYVFGLALTLALLAGIVLNVSSAWAQSEKLWGLMGFWQNPGSFPGDYAIYKLAVTPRDELRLRLISTHSQTGSYDAGAQKYTLSVTDRNLTGTVTWSIYYKATNAWRACRVSPRTFPVTGRISSDWNTIVLTWTFPGFDVSSCRWGGEPFENILQFKRQP